MQRCWRCTASPKRARCAGRWTWTRWISIRTRTVGWVERSETHPTKPLPQDHPASAGSHQLVSLKQAAKARGFRRSCSDTAIAFVGAAEAASAFSPQPSRSEEHTSELQYLMRL